MGRRFRPGQAALGFVINSSGHVGIKMNHKLFKKEVKLSQDNVCPVQPGSVREGAGSRLKRYLLGSQCWKLRTACVEIALARSGLNANLEKKFVPTS